MSSTYMTCVTVGAPMLALTPLMFLRLRGVCYCYLNNGFRCLNNITHISIDFFIHMYFHQTTTTLVKISFQMGPKLFIKQSRENLLSNYE